MITNLKLQKSEVEKHQKKVSKKQHIYGPTEIKNSVELKHVKNTYKNNDDILLYESIEDDSAFIIQTKSKAAIDLFRTTYETEKEYVKAISEMICLNMIIYNKIQNILDSNTFINIKCKTNTLILDYNSYIKKLNNGLQVCYSLLENISHMNNGSEIIVELNKDMVSKIESEFSKTTTFIVKD